VKQVIGDPDPRRLSTGYVERQNLSRWMSMRRLTRLPNAFSKKIENHAAPIALHLLHQNFARGLKTLRIAPAVATGLSDHVWSHEELAALTN